MDFFCSLCTCMYSILYLLPESSVFFLKAADLENILENQIYFKISLQIHIIVVRNQNKG